MATRSDGSGGGSGLHDEYVDFGRARRPGRGRLPRLLLACLVAAAVVIVVVRAGKHGPAPARPVTVIRLGHPLLGIRAGWQLFGLDSAGLVAITPASGIITKTTLPPPEGDGPVSLVLQPHAALIRPLDNVPGYLIPDGEPARPLTGQFAAGGLLLPGPEPTQTWVVPGTGRVLSLLGPGGEQTGTRLTLPADGQWAPQSAMSDGRGGVLVSSDTGRQYDADPLPLTPVSALLAAVGPARWLGVSCQRGSRPCHNVVIDPATGAERALAGAAAADLALAL